MVIRRRAARIRSGLLVMLFCGLVGSTAWAREKSLKLATLAPKGTSYHQMLMEMREQWREAPGGGAKLTIYPDGQMGGEADMVRRMRVGQIQVALMTASGLAEIDPSVTALQNLPMMFQTLEEAKYVRGELRPLIEAKFREKGFVILFLEDAGWVKFFSRVEAASPEDYKKLKIYALASDVKAIQLWKSAGYNPIALDTTAMLTGLKTSMVDVVPSPPVYALAAQIYRPAPFMLDLNWAPLVGGMVITEEAWKDLAEETRTSLQASAVETGAKLMARSREENDEAVKAMVERGLKVLQPTAEQSAAWRTSVEKAYPSIRGQIVPEDLFDKVKALLEAYRKQEKAPPTAKKPEEAPAKAP